MGTPESLIQISLVGEALEHGPVGILVADENMQYIAANEYACRLLGYTRAELLQLRVVDVARSDDTAAQYDEMMREGVRVGTITLTRKDGSEFAARYRASETAVVGMTLYVSALWEDDS